MRHLRSALVLALVLALFGGTSGLAQAAGTAKISGQVIEAGTGLALSGVLVAAVGPSTTKATTDSKGNFTLDNLSPGTYSLLASLNGYETTETDPFPIEEGKTQAVTLAIQRLSGFTSGIKTLGRTTIHASATLQSAAVISSTVPATTLIKQNIYRAADALRRLPNINVNGGFGGGETASPADDIALDIRGIGLQETIAMVDGNPVGPGFNASYNFSLSPVYGLRDVKVVYGSGSDFYGVNAIGGVVDMQTLQPTNQPEATISQSWGTWNNLSTAVQATGSTSGNRFGYAIALGTSGTEGYFNHARFYQASAAFDPWAVDPAVRALGVYTDDTSSTNKGSLVKGRFSFSDNSHLTATWLSGANWIDKTGNGDNDYLPYEVALQSGQNQLAAALASGGSDLCNKANPATFTVGANANGGAPGTGPGGKADGGSACQTPQSYAAGTSGYQGAGPAWQSYGANAYALNYDDTIGKHTVTLRTFTNTYVHTYDRTFQLPFINVFGDNPFFYNQSASNTGASLSDDIANLSNELGFGYFWENSAASNVVVGKPQKGPITHDTAFFLRDAWHPINSHLTSYGNLWFKNSTITSTSFVDPRLAFVWQQGNDVFRLAGGLTSTQPFPSQIVSPFVPLALGSFNGHISCAGPFSNSVGNIPSSALKPERGIDQEFSFGHRFEGDSTVQLTLYNENVYKKIYTGVSLPLSDLTVPFDASGYINAVASFCGISPTVAAGLVGVNGTANLGHTLAQGFELTGRGRISQAFFVDYSYSTEVSVIKSHDPSLINPLFGGNVKYIPDAQQPLVPLHKANVNLDYTFPHNIEVALDTYYEAANNPKNLPAFTFSNLIVSAPIGPGLFSTAVNNLWKTDAFYEGRIGEGYPLPLNQYATASNYQPFFGNSSTERFGLPFRTISFTYTLKVK